MRAFISGLSVLFGLTPVISGSAFAGNDADVAKQLANPVAALISVPIQANYDENFGLNDHGSVW